MCTLEQASGLLLGTAIGDSIGLPREGLSSRRAARLFGHPPLTHRLLPFGRGLVSDDTEHACMTAVALLRSHGQLPAFQKHLARQLRLWFLALPPGIGIATAKACIKLCLGFSPDRSGVGSAGNGPAMRAPIIGLYAADDIKQLCALVTASTSITHTHPDAHDGALAIALAAAFAARNPIIAPQTYLDFIRPHLTGKPTLALIETAVANLHLPLPEYLKRLQPPRGVSGWINHTTPAALHVWLRHPGQFRPAVEEVIQAGGDTDTTAAIVGALVGITSGPSAIPNIWIAGLTDYPRSVSYLSALSQALATKSSPPRLNGIVIPIRNLALLLVVLVHGFRRLAPPY